MNIMLVSVSERTKEVGLIKAIGGKSRMVRRQFLLEAVIISMLGALFGIVFGVLVGNLFSIVLNTGFRGAMELGDVRHYYLQHRRLAGRLVSCTKSRAS